MHKNYSVGLIVPTLNAGNGWNDWLERVNNQSLRPARLLVIDSSSDDDTADLARARGFEVVTIAREAFNHGGTRQQAADMLENCDILLYLTQDALLATRDSLSRLVSAFEDHEVAVAYGRQLPHPQAGPIAAHARLFNYPDSSVKKTRADIPRLGIKAAFSSDSFAAYRRADLIAIGGFAPNLNFGEDAHVATRLLLSGKAVQYVAEAEVFHSHDYSMAEDFRRYLDIGAFHSQERWMIEALGTAGGEGVRFVRSELAYLLTIAPSLIPSALGRTILKYLAYRIGKRYKRASLTSRAKK